MTTYKARNGTPVTILQEVFLGTFTDTKGVSHTAIFHRDGTCNSVDDELANERDLDLVSLIPAKPTKLER